MEDSKGKFYKSLLELVNTKINAFNGPNVIELHRRGDADYEAVNGPFLYINRGNLPGTSENCCGCLMHVKHHDYGKMMRLALCFVSAVENYFYNERKVERPRNEPGYEFSPVGYVQLEWTGSDLDMNYHRFAVLFDSPYAPEKKFQTGGRVEFSAMHDEEMVKLGRAAAVLWQEMFGEEY